MVNVWLSLYLDEAFDARWRWDSSVMAWFGAG
jgi:hypothetical protein